MPVPEHRSRVPQRGPARSWGHDRGRTRRHFGHRARLLSRCRPGWQDRSCRAGGYGSARPEIRGRGAGADRVNRACGGWVPDGGRRCQAPAGCVGRPGRTGNAGPAGRSSRWPARCARTRPGIARRARPARPPSFTGVDDTPSMISVKAGRGAPDQPECDVSRTAIWLGQVHLFRARYVSAPRGAVVSDGGERLSSSCRRSGGVKLAAA